MSAVFTSNYAALYDHIYQDKDYEAECDLLERLFAAYGQDVRHVLDLGCGTGNHSIRLGLRGYDVCGIDRSEEMLAFARQKVNGKQNSIRFIQGDIRFADLAHHFDAAILMFAVLGYQCEDRDVLLTLSGARRHLRPGGLLIFDVWYGPSVINQKPERRSRVVSTGSERILRTAEGELSKQAQVCTVRIRAWRESEPEKTFVEESHRVRYFFPDEIENFATQTGFKILRIGAFPDVDTDPNEMSWNVLCVAQAI